MKVGSFTTTNDKGQLVIPKDMRDALGIDSSVTLNLVLAGNGIYVYPVEEFITKSETESSYIQLLEKTKSAWANDDFNDVEQNRSRIELEASKSRKNRW
jgi:AbrB family looped-hinge helix DNA binding protein